VPALIQALVGKLKLATPLRHGVTNFSLSVPVSACADTRGGIFSRVFLRDKLKFVVSSRTCWQAEACHSTAARSDKL